MQSRLYKVTVKYTKYKAKSSRRVRNVARTRRHNLDHAQCAPCSNSYGLISTKPLFLSVKIDLRLFSFVLKCKNWQSHVLRACDLNASENCISASPVVLHRLLADCTYWLLTMHYSIVVINTRESNKETEVSFRIFMIKEFPQVSTGTAHSTEAIMPVLVQADKLKCTTKIQQSRTEQTSILVISSKACRIPGRQTDSQIGEPSLEACRLSL